jgi:hypothetical protein
VERPFPLVAAARPDAAVEGWLAAQVGEVGDLARRWFAELRACGDDVLETMHDGQATACLPSTAFAYVAAHRAHVAVGFFAGAELPDPAGLLRGDGRYMRHVRLTPGEPVDEPALRALVHAACAAARFVRAAPP